VKTEPAAGAVEHAIALVAARSLPEKKLREKIARRYGAAETDAAVARLRELRLVDDAAWAERFVRERFERSDKGRHRIRQELARAGIDAATIDEVIERVLDGDGERRKAMRVLERMRAQLERGSVAGPDASAREHDDERASEHVRNRLFRRMLARGHPAALVRDLLDVS